MAQRGAIGRDMAAAIYARLLDLLLPPACYRCGRNSIGTDQVRRPLWCARCARELGMAADPNRVSKLQCRRCAAFLGSAAAADETAEHLCPCCFDLPSQPTSIVALGDYHGGLRRWVIDAKRNPDALLLAGLADALSRRLSLSEIPGRVDLIVPVPSRGAWSSEGNWLQRQVTSQIRHRFEGSSGELPRRLAERLAQRLGLPMEANLVQYRRFVSKQGKLDRLTRRRNVTGSMAVNCSLATRWKWRIVQFGRERARRWRQFVEEGPKRRNRLRMIAWIAARTIQAANEQGRLAISETRTDAETVATGKTACAGFAETFERRLEGRRILVIDDVATSGATLAEMVRVLRAAGAIEVHAAVLARAASFR